MGLFLSYSAAALAVFAHVGLVAVAFAASYRVAGHMNFFLSSIWTVAAYGMYELYRVAKLPFPVAIAVVVLVCMLLQWAALGLFRWLGHGTVLLVSFGLYLILDNTVQGLWGASQLMINGPLNGVVTLGSVGKVLIVFPQANLVALVILVLLMVAGWLLFKRTNLGRIIRGIADNRTLAATCGLPVRQAETLVYLAAGLLVGVSGILTALNTGAELGRGLPLVVNGMMAAIIAGRTVILGAVVGAALFSALDVGLLAVFGITWQVLGTYSVLIVLIVLNPQGLLPREITDLRLRWLTPATRLPGPEMQMSEE